MNVKERLKEAYENVAFFADSTWSNGPNSYQKSNLELYLLDRHVEDVLNENRPRTVKECIPNSRLAQYGNYGYNEPREMSYASSVSKTETNLVIRAATEPWEMPEVAELYRWFLTSQPERSCCPAVGSGTYESPLLNVSAFEDKILKILITEERVKTLWNGNLQYGEVCSKSGQLAANLFTSPLKNFILCNNKGVYDVNWFQNVSVSQDFKLLERLCESCLEQNESITAFLTGTSESTLVHSEATSSEILYSEVLQGLSPSRKILTTLQKEQKPPPAEEPSSNNENFTNYTILNTQRTTLEDPIKNEPSCSSLQKNSIKAPPQKISSTNLLQTEPNTRFKYPNSTVPPLPRTTPQPSSFIHQAYFYSSAQPLAQRWNPPYYPTQIFTSSWFQHSVVQSNALEPSSSTDFGRQLVHRTRSEEVTTSNAEERPVSTSISEELELQALEQYTSSNENFYQELERQAAEQYASYQD